MTKGEEIEREAAAYYGTSYGGVLAARIDAALAEEREAGREEAHDTYHNECKPALLKKVREDAIRDEKIFGVMALEVGRAALIAQVREWVEGNSSLDMRRIAFGQPVVRHLDAVAFLAFLDTLGRKP